MKCWVITRRVFASDRLPNKRIHQLYGLVVNTDRHTDPSRHGISIRHIILGLFVFLLLWFGGPHNTCHNRLSEAFTHDHFGFHGVTVNPSVTKLCSFKVSNVYSKVKTKWDSTTHMKVIHLYHCLSHHCRNFFVDGLLIVSVCVTVRTVNQILDNSVFWIVTRRNSWWWLLRGGDVHELVKVEVAWHLSWVVWQVTCQSIWPE